MPTPRELAFAAIDTERLYQEARENKEGWQKKKRVGEWLVLLTHYVAEANKTWCNSTGDVETLHVVRKIAGIAVHCMEENGAPVRVLPDELLPFATPPVEEG
jgi:hypothetical protein